MQPHLLAVDAGNSKTVAMVVDAEANILGIGRAGRGDIYGAATEMAAVREVLSAIHTALAAARSAPHLIRAAAFRLAGVDFAEDAEFWHHRIQQLLPGMGRWSVLNDAFASLRLADLSGVGLAITVGTGPAIAARSVDGREACSGMFVLDDLGGQGLGNSALDAVFRAWMGLAEPTALEAKLLAHYGCSNVWQLRHEFMRRESRRAEQERWEAAKIVLELADAGDAVSQRIVETQARAFIDYAGWCAAEVGCSLADGTLPVVLNGSVVQSQSGAMRDALLARLRDIAPAAPVRVADAPPLHGIALDALHEGGVPLTPKHLATLAQIDLRDVLRT